MDQTFTQAAHLADTEREAQIAALLAEHLYADPGCRCGWSRTRASGLEPRSWTTHVASVLAAREAAAAAIRER